PEGLRRLTPGGIAPKSLYYNIKAFHENGFKPAQPDPDPRQTAYRLLRRCAASVEAGGVERVGPDHRQKRNRRVSVSGRRDAAGRLQDSEARGFLARAARKIPCRPQRPLHDALRTQESSIVPKALYRESAGGVCAGACAASGVSPPPLTGIPKAFCRRI